MPWAVGVGGTGVDVGVGMDCTALHCTYDVKREKKRLRVADPLLQ
jgi:hypothetical protein